MTAFDRAWALVKAERGTREFFEERWKPKEKPPPCKFCDSTNTTWAMDSFSDIKHRLYDGPPPLWGVRCYTCDLYFMPEGPDKMSADALVHEMFTSQIFPDSTPPGIPEDME